MISLPLARIKIDAKQGTVFLVLLIAMSLVPLIRVQLVSGMLVNAMLFLAVSYVGKRAGFALSILPSLVAFWVGLVPAVALPFIPWIMASNVLLVAVFAAAQNSHSLVRYGTSVTAKGIFLLLFGSLVGTLLGGASFAHILSTMFGWIQFVTAGAGAVLAYTMVRVTRKA